MHNGHNRYETGASTRIWESGRIDLLFSAARPFPKNSRTTPPAADRISMKIV
jgi:hypothetical protein